MKYYTHDYKFISLGNCVTDENFRECCEALEKGEKIRPRSSCLGFGFTNSVNMDCHKKLLAKYGEKLEHELIYCNNYNSFEYKLKF